MSWTETPLHFIDFEGGTASGILEFGVVTVRDGGIAGVRTRLCRALGKIRVEDEAIHGLRREELQTHAPFADEFEYFAGLREQGPLAAHYAGVENALLKSVWPYPRTSPDFVRPGRTITDWAPWIDSARIYGELYPECGSTALQSVVASFGLQAELDALAAAHCPAGRRRYHAALYDALAGALLLVALARDPRGRALSLMQLFSLSTLDVGRRNQFSQDELFGG